MSTETTRLQRLKLTEPVRLYLWPVAALLLVSGVGGGIAAGDWYRLVLFVSAGLLLLLAAEAARASVFSPAAVVRTAIRARQ